MIVFLPDGTTTWHRVRVRHVPFMERRYRGSNGSSMLHQQQAIGTREQAAGLTADQSSMIPITSS
jgi:hypothetical protein